MLTFALKTALKTGHRHRQSLKLDQGDHAEPFCLGAVLPFSAVVWLQHFSSLPLCL